MPPKRPTPIRSASSCPTLVTAAREREQHDVGDERLHGDALLAVAVGEAAPDRRQQPREQRRHADQHAGPERRVLGLRTPSSRTKRGRNGSTKAKPVKTANTIATVTSRLRRAAEAGRARHESSQNSPSASSPRTSSRTRPRPLEPSARATSAARPSRPTRGSGPAVTTTSRQRTPWLQPVPSALLAASLPATASASASARSGGAGGQRRRLLRVHQLADEARAEARERPLDARRSPRGRGRCRSP